LNIVIPLRPHYLLKLASSLMSLYWNAKQLLSL
jgi:hypothetical protein